MTLMAGFSASRHSSAPVELAAQIARTTGESIIAASVIERRLPPQADPIEDEYAGHVATAAERALLGAVDELPRGTGITVEVQHARSVPDGLMALAAAHDVSVVTVDRRRPDCSAGSRSAASRTGWCTPPRCPSRSHPARTARGRCPCAG
ncbi:hypothetical protein MTP03_36150 [Tsukamurella sp. PLM1]|nr:hypothetical protein MTP03_36150 [Tsukamurella sp. PLM1]